MEPSKHEDHRLELNSQLPVQQQLENFGRGIADADWHASLLNRYLDYIGTDLQTAVGSVKSDDLRRELMSMAAPVLTELQTRSVPLELDVQTKVVTAPTPLGNAMVTYGIGNRAAITEAMKPALCRLAALRRCVATVAELERQRAQVAAKLDKVLTKKTDFERDLGTLSKLEDSKTTQANELREKIAAAEENVARRRKQLHEIDEELRRCLANVGTADAPDMLAALDAVLVQRREIQFVVFDAPLARRLARRRRVALAASVVGILALTGLAIYNVWRVQKPAPATTTVATPARGPIRAGKRGAANDSPFVRARTSPELRDAMIALSGDNRRETNSVFQRVQTELTSKESQTAAATILMPLMQEKTLLQGVPPADIADRKIDVPDSDVVFKVADFFLAGLVDQFGEVTIEFLTENQKKLPTSGDYVFVPAILCGHNLMLRLGVPIYGGQLLYEISFDQPFLLTCDKSSN